MAILKEKKTSAAALKKAALALQVSQVRTTLEAAGAASRVHTIASLATELGESHVVVAKLLADKTLKPDLLVLNPKAETSAVVLRRDLGLLAQSDALMHFVAEAVRTKRVAKKPKNFGVKEFLADSGLGKPFAELKAEFQAALERRIQLSGVPAELNDLIVPQVTAAQLAEKLVAVIRSQRRLGGGAYPVPPDQWSSLGVQVDKKSLAAALKQTAFKSAVTILKSKRYLLTADLESPPAAWIGEALAAALGATANGKNTVLSAADLSAILLGKAEAGFAQAVERTAERGELGAEVAWLWQKGVRLFLRRGDIEPKTPSRPAAVVAPHIASGDFNARFHAAFDRANAKSGGRNFVKLFDVRRELPDVPPEVFNAGLRELRLADRYAINSSEGGERTLTAAEREAGIQEAGSLLVYISRK